MLREEFELLLEEKKVKKPNEEEWDIINFVYTWHPAISNVEGKKQIADLYIIGGMSCIRGMLPDAKMTLILESEIEKNKKEIRALQKKNEELIKKIESIIK